MQWKNIISGKPRGEMNSGYNIKINEKKVNLLETHNKVIYKSFILKKMDRSKAFKRYSEKYNIREDKWKSIYRLPHELDISNRAKETQYKILHNYIPTNQLLYKMNIIQSPRCNFCNLYDQTTTHLFFDCLVVKNFWFNVLEWLESDHEIILNIVLSDVLFGVTEIPNDLFINRVIIYAKMYIFNCKCIEIDLTIREFLNLLNRH